MAQAPKDLSGEVVIHHPNCGADFQFRQYDEENNVNYFQCVGCGLAIRIDAFIVGDVQEQGNAENTSVQVAEPEAPTSDEITESTQEAPRQESSKKHRKQQ